MPSEEWDALSVRECIVQLGVAEVGVRYVNGDFGWGDLGLAVFTGEDELGVGLPSELWWDIAMAALDACPDDESVELLGEDIFDRMRARPGFADRLLDEGTRNSRVARLFAVMERALRSERVTSGFWFQ